MSKWLIKYPDEETNPNFGKEPEKRAIEELLETGMVIVDKHLGPTSHQITYWIKDMFNLKKAGHTGTLDPNASGVLPVLLGRSTRLLPLFQKLDKEYVGVMHLHKDIGLDTLRDFITNNFIGEIVQIPPKRSAVARRPRRRKLYFCDLLEKDGKDVLFHIGCESGFYVRKFVHDVGQKLKIGAHLAELRRVKVGNFDEKQAYPLVDIRDAFEHWKETGDEKPLREMVKPIEFMLDHVKKVFIKDSAIPRIANGAPLFVAGVVRIQEDIRKGDIVAVMSLKNELVSYGYAKMDSEEMLKAKRGIAVTTDRVFIKKDVYKLE
ncbi:MAG: RNA-guided pseudouridylation complex pseudouridine synthase subunit Cbf5 [Candidatus Aenigmarchaeota archaeon]|nr:RNA-guided pseudouridylation complex pseudouridine synthase subunit Cbf5 [Candidatus Aenigmarchaeota archaeon]